MKLLLSILVVVPLLAGLYYVVAIRLPQRSTWSGAYYEEHSTPQYQAAMAALSKLDLSNCTDILDVGCGSGRITEIIALKARKAHVEGIDASESMIKVAREKYDLPNLKFAVLNAENIDYDQKFNSVVSFSCFHWIKDKEKVLQAIAKSIKPGGTLLIVGCLKSQNDPILRAFLSLKQVAPWSDLLSHVDPQTQFYPLDMQDLKEIIVKVGLEPIKIKEITQPTHFKSKEELAEWVIGWACGLPLVSRLPNEKQKALVSALIEQFLQTQNISDGKPITYAWPCLLVYARKPFPVKSIGQK